MNLEKEIRNILFKPMARTKRSEAILHLMKTFGFRAFIAGSGTQSYRDFLEESGLDNTDVEPQQESDTKSDM